MRGPRWAWIPVGGSSHTWHWELVLRFLIPQLFFHTLNFCHSLPPTRQVCTPSHDVLMAKLSQSQVGGRLVRLGKSFKLLILIIGFMPLVSSLLQSVGMMTQIFPPKFQLSLGLSCFKYCRNICYFKSWSVSPRYWVLILLLVQPRNLLWKAGALWLFWLSNDSWDSITVKPK